MLVFYLWMDLTSTSPFEWSTKTIVLSTPSTLTITSISTECSRQMFTGYNDTLYVQLIVSPTYRIFISVDVFRRENLGADCRFTNIPGPEH